MDKLIPYDFSERLQQFHCSRCGTIMLTRVSWSVMDANKGVHWDIMSGTLERFDGIFEIAAHEFVSDTLDGGFADFLTTVNGKIIERWSDRPWKSEQLPLFWQSQERPKLQRNQSDLLPVRCKCAGVQLWISRPREESRNAMRKSLALVLHICQFQLTKVSRRFRRRALVAYGQRSKVSWYHVCL